MPDTNILQFPKRVAPSPAADRNDLLLAKIVKALQAMKELHAELEDLKSILEAQNSKVSSD